MTQFLLWLKIVRSPNRVAHRQWLGGHLYSLRLEWASGADGEWSQLYRWHRDDGEPISVRYSTYDMAIVNFGRFSPAEYEPAEVIESVPTWRDLRQHLEAKE